MSDTDQDNRNTTDENDNLGDQEGDGRQSGTGLDPKAEPDQETVQEIEEERGERLDPENRPDNAEVDNSQREFDVDRGKFTDSEDYNEDEPAPFSDPEDPNNPDNKASDASDADAPAEAESKSDDEKTG